MEENEKLKQSFLHWWNNEGSGFRPHDNEDVEEFAKRLCEIAWFNGADTKKHMNDNTVGES